MARDRGPAGTIDDVCDALSHPVRRAILDALEGTEAVAVETIVAEINGSDTYPSGNGDRVGGADRVEVVLHHRHLPKLAEADVIDYDPGTATVARDSNADVADDLLDALSGAGDE